MSSVGLIWAQSKEGVIGDHGGMPWHVPEDLAHFAAVTKGHPVVMGRKTWDSIPSRYRPFSERTNIVVTRQAGWEAEGAVVVHSLDHALKEASDAPGGELTWLIGGGELFAQALGRPEVARAVVTFLDLAVGGDTFAPELGPEWRVESADPSEAGWHESRTATRYRFVEFTRA